jgi:ribosome biogenesis SPOUT family RNA methylase Rps3
MELLQSISQAMEEARQKNSADAFSQLGYNLAKLKDQVREKIQEQTMGAINAIVRKLESNQPLTPEEKAFVRLWIVGDAEGYGRMEKTLKEWLTEYRRLVGLIKDYAQRS